MIRFVHKGDFEKTRKFFKRAQERRYMASLDQYARECVKALSAATPEDSGETASSWGYKVSQESGGFKITFTNDNIVDGYNVAILIQYGHGTRGGTYVEGQDFINPVIRPAFDKIVDEMWREVTSS